MQILFDTAPVGVSRTYYEKDIDFRYWSYTSFWERDPLPGLNIRVTLQPLANATQEGWEDEAKKMVAQVIRTVPWDVQSVLVLIGQDSCMGFLAASGVTTLETCAEKAPRWVLEGILEGMNSAYFSKNFEYPVKTAWQRILEED